MWGDGERTVEVAFTVTIWRTVAAVDAEGRWCWRGGSRSSVSTKTLHLIIVPTVSGTVREGMSAGRSEDGADRCAQHGETVREGPRPEVSLTVWASVAGWFADGPPDGNLQRAFAMAIRRTVMDTVGDDHQTLTWIVSPTVSGMMARVAATERADGEWCPGAPDGPSRGW
jgi:hypothetical protein